MFKVGDKVEWNYDKEGIFFWENAPKVMTVKAVYGRLISLENHPLN